MNELISKVWSNKLFHVCADKIEKKWLMREMGMEFDGEFTAEDARKALQASAILACSENLEHRMKAFKVATTAFELYADGQIPVAEAVRVVLARLDNFPSIKTNNKIDLAGASLPTSLALEEFVGAAAREVVVDNEKIVLTKFQYDLWQALRSGKRVAVSAPTSAGKSFVLQSYIHSLFDEESRIVFYIVPTRALIAQVFFDISECFKNSKKPKPLILSVPLNPELPVPENAIFVLTQERVKLVLDSHPKLIANVVIVDEAHSIVEGGRGVLLQGVVDELLNRNQVAQVLFASPMIKNLSKFGESFGISDVLEVASKEPTVAQNFLLLALEPEFKKVVTVRTVGDGARFPEFVGEIVFQEEMVNRVSEMVAISAKVGLGATNIIYANGADEAEQIAIKLAAIFSNRIPTPRQLALSQLARESVHSSYLLAECLKKGVGFHYADIPTSVRRSVEKAMSDGDIDFLVCTSTLLQGVNLPAKNIFLCRPRKGNLNPLEATDFWNLAGRAGRLRREFHGNIYLIEYDTWKKQPLKEPKDTNIIPALEAGVRNNTRELVQVISNYDPRDVRENPDLESMVVRLYSDYMDGELARTFHRMGVFEDDVPYRMIFDALAGADEVVSVPHSVLRHSANISIHRQQQLFNWFVGEIKKGKSHALALLPRHPREKNVYESYASIMKVCYGILLGRDTDRYRTHRFHAFMALQWMQGTILPIILENQIARGAERYPEKESRSIIRMTLQVIERDIRYQAVRIFGCYIALLKYAFEVLGYKSLSLKIPPVPLFLEMGASDRTMISLLSLGVSRVSSKKITEVARNKNMDVLAVVSWLKSADLKSFGLSVMLLEELKQVLDAF